MPMCGAGLAFAGAGMDHDQTFFDGLLGDDPVMRRLELAHFLGMAGIALGFGQAVGWASVMVTAP